MTFSGQFCWQLGLRALFLRALETFLFLVYIEGLDFVLQGFISYFFLELGCLGELQEGRWLGYFAMPLWLALWLVP